MKTVFGACLLTLLFVTTLSLSPVALAADSVQNAQQSPLIFGVVNQQSPIQTAERWNPILRYLQNKTGVRFQLKMGSTIDATNRMMGNGEFDLVFTNHNFQEEFDGKYKVLARWAGKPMHGAIVTMEDSTIRGIKDLQGRTLAFPSAEAFAGYAVPNLALKEADVRIIAKFAGNQEGALAQLKARQVDAAAVNSRFVASYSQREGVKLRTVFLSEAYHEIPVVIHPRVPPQLAADIRLALIGMAADPAAQSILNDAKCPGFEAANDRDYDNVRHIYRLIGQ